MKIFLLTILSILTVTNLYPQSAIFVQFSGNDQNSGAISEPLATIEKALTVSRATGIKQIYIREGTYFVKNITIQPIDSGLFISAYNNERVIFNGGKLLKGLRKEGKFLVATLSKTGNEAIDFRFLLVNGSFRERARLPEIGAYTHLSKWNAKLLPYTEGSWDQKPTDSDLSQMIFNPLDIGSWIDIANAEITLYHDYDESYVQIKNIDFDKHTIFFSNHLTKPAGSFANKNPNASKYVIWNIKEGMKHPGQWYFDKNNSRLYYWPLQGEVLSEVNINVPLTQSILVFSKGAKNISIEGINFCCTTSPMLNPGYASTKINGAISGDSVSNITLRKINVFNVGNWAYRIKGNNIDWHNCSCYNLGAGGIYYSGNDMKIDSCQVYDAGLLFKGSVGILGSGNNNQITSTEIHNIPYCGINGVGTNSIVENCLIYSIKTFMNDGGCIYSIRSRSLIVRHNAMLEHSSNRLKKNAIYFDELSEGCVAEDNLVLNAVRPVLVYIGKSNSFVNNIFIDKKSQVVSFTYSSDLTFEKNIFYGDTIFFMGPTKETAIQNAASDKNVMAKYQVANGIKVFTGNVLYSRSGAVLKRKLLQHQIVDTEKVSFIWGNAFANPFFANETIANFKYSEQSDAKQLGIKELDFENVGCTHSFGKLYLSMKDSI